MAGEPLVLRAGWADGERAARRDDSIGWMEATAHRSADLLVHCCCCRCCCYWPYVMRDDRCCAPPYKQASPGPNWVCVQEVILSSRANATLRSMSSRITLTSSITRHGWSHDIISPSCRPAGPVFCPGYSNHFSSNPTSFSVLFTSDVNWIKTNVWHKGRRWWSRHASSVYYIIICIHVGGASCSIFADDARRQCRSTAVSCDSQSPPIRDANVAFNYYVCVAQAVRPVHSLR